MSNCLSFAFLTDTSRESRIIYLTMNSRSESTYIWASINLFQFFMEYDWPFDMQFHIFSFRVNSFIIIQFSFGFVGCNFWIVYFKNRLFFLWLPCLLFFYFFSLFFFPLLNSVWFSQVFLICQVSVVYLMIFLLYLLMPQNIIWIFIFTPVFSVSGFN